ncbi:Uncharacterised protein [Raoultella terrigena]|uniref:Uncharacterized protein n=1 Tax=Raoultella terrigena TaxID=577 RepID=A0A4U9D9G3_RAOTE|nr:Uncharacterised protein [Raoultella terrigena]
MVPLFPIMIAITLLIIILQVRSMAAMVMVFLTAPLGLIGVVPTLLLFQPAFWHQYPGGADRAVGHSDA